MQAEPSIDPSLMCWYACLGEEGIKEPLLAATIVAGRCGHSLQMSLKTEVESTTVMAKAVVLSETRAYSNAAVDPCSKQLASAIR